MPNKPTYEELELRVTDLENALSKRMRTEEALRESEEKYRSLFESAPIGIGVSDTDGNIINFNNAILKTSGYSREDIFNKKNMRELYYNPDDRNKVLSLFKKNGFIDALEVQFKRKDGTPHDTLLYLRPMKLGEKTYFHAMVQDITKQKHAEAMLRRVNEELEQRVESRTVELKVSNEQLEIQKKNLEEVNIALRVLLKKRDEDKSNMEKKVVSNLNELILPYMEKLECSDLDNHQRALMGILKSNLNEITSPFTQSLSNHYAGFTPSEIQIANLIKQGKTSKQMAEVLNLSSRTIETHRKNIREKLGLKKNKINLRTHLMSIQ